VEVRCKACGPKFNHGATFVLRAAIACGHARHAQHGPTLGLLQPWLDAAQLAKHGRRGYGAEVWAARQLAGQTKQCGCWRFGSGKCVRGAHAVARDTQTISRISEDSG